MKHSQLLIACAALVALAWVIAHVGLSTVVTQLKGMRIALPIVLCLSTLRLFLQSATWSSSLNGENVVVSTTTLMAVRLASQSMGYLTVLGPVVSEPMKIKLLGASSERTMTATFLDTGVYWFTSTLFAIAGVLSLCVIATHGAAYRWIPAVPVLVFATLTIRRRTPILAGIVRPFGRRVPSWLTRAEQFETSIRAYRLQQPALVRRMCWVGLLCQLLIAAEVVVFLWSLHVSIHFWAVMAIEGLTRSFKLASGWVPARVGCDEGGAMSAFAVAGLSPTLGLGLALTRRVRDLVWAVVGILWLAWSSRHKTARAVLTLGHSSTVPERGV